MALRAAHIAGLRRSTGLMFAVPERVRYCEDRYRLAQRLGFEGVAANSIDVSSDRDFAVEFAFVLTMVGVLLLGAALDHISYQEAFDALQGVLPVFISFVAAILGFC